MLRDALVDAGLMVKREKLGDQVAEALRYLIATGRLQPGTRLVETEVASMLQVSRVPVRDAIKKLSTEGLVSYSPGNGAYVADLSPDDLRILVDLRAKMEEYAIELAVSRITPEGIAELRHLLEAMSDAARQNDPTKVRTCDAQLHRVIWRHTGSHRLTELLSLIISPLWVWQMRVTSDWQQMALAIHAPIVEALAARDVARARDALRVHTQHVLRGVGVTDSEDST